MINEIVYRKVDLEKIKQDLGSGAKAMIRHLSNAKQKTNRISDMYVLASRCKEKEGLGKEVKIPVREFFTRLADLHYGKVVGRQFEWSPSALMVLGSLENNPSPRAQHTVGQIDRAKASAVRRLRRHVDGIYKGNLASLANLIYDSRNPCAIDWKHSISVEDGGPILVGMIGPERVHSKQALEKIMAHLRSYLDEYEQQLTKSLP